MSEYELVSKKFSPDAGVDVDAKTATEASQAVEINARAGYFTSSTTTLAAKTTEAITLTNKFIKSVNSIVICKVAGGGAGDPVVGIVTEAAGSAVITILNADPANACDEAYKVKFVIFNPTV